MDNIGNFIGEHIWILVVIFFLWCYFKQTGASDAVKGAASKAKDKVPGKGGSSSSGSDE